MPQYLRAIIPGGTFFFTVALLERRRTLLTDHIEALRASFEKVRRTCPLRIDAAVILPDHLHCIWTLPDGDADFSTRWRLIKSAFARNFESDERLTRRRVQKQERGIWQRRFWEHTIRDEQDFEVHADYIHFNPVKHGHVGRAADWAHSSFRRYVAKGIYPHNWAAEPEIGKLDYE